MPPDLDEKLRDRSAKVLYLFETVLYIVVGVLLAIAAVVVLIDVGAIVTRGIEKRALSEYSLQVLDHLLIVLVLVEVLHTVRISLRSKEILLEPFLIVGLIASVRRVLVITMQAAKMTGEGSTTTDPVAFRNSMIELALVGFLVFAFVFSIYFLRRTPNEEELIQ
jgi:uncharacterized membrane protein (DUF373 family)